MNLKSFFCIQQAKRKLEEGQKNDTHQSIFFHNDTFYGKLSMQDAFSTFNKQERPNNNLEMPGSGGLSEKQKLPLNCP